MFIKYGIGRNLQLSNILLFFLLLILVTLIIVKGMVGLVLLVALALLLTGLVRPKYLFLLVIALLPMETVDIPGLSSGSYAKVVGVVLTACLILRFMVMRERIPRDDFYKLFLLFLVGGSFSFLVAKDMRVGIIAYTVYISLFAFYVIVRYFVRDYERLQEVLNYLIVSSVIISSYFYLTGAVEKAEGGVIRTAGGMGDANGFAAYILAILPFAVFRAMKSSGALKQMFWGCAGIFLVLVVLSGSRGGLLGLLGCGSVFLAYYGGKSRAKVISMLLLIGVLAFYVVPDQYWFRASTIIHPEREKGNSIAGRSAALKAGLQMAGDHPVTGVGIGNFRLALKDYGMPFEMVAHNTYLEVLTGGGLLHFIPFCLILAACWRKSSPRYPEREGFRDLFICLRASLVALLITLFFLSVPHMKILWFLLATISSAHYIAAERPFWHRMGN